MTNLDGHPVLGFPSPEEGFFGRIVDPGLLGASIRRHSSAFRFLTYILIAFLTVAAYLVLAQVQNGEFGFPLDDAWIHQVYARNLATRGEFAFFAGQPSTGSTSPLWAILLAGGYAFHIDFRLWSATLGVLLLALSALFARRLALRLHATNLVAEVFVPVFVVLEWHLTWAALSGMETLLFVFLSLALVESFLGGLHPFWLGLLAGLLTLTRPEGAVLGALVALAFLLKARAKSSGLSTLLRQLSAFACALGLVVLPYLLFNWATSGTLLPNTFYAKSREYGALLNQATFLVRWISLYRQPLLGAQILLLPGVFWLAWRLVRLREWGQLVPLVWMGALPALYAARLPVDYQFGRYEMPVIPFIAIYGIVGTGELLKRIRLRVIRRAWALSTAMLLLAFAWLGANQYSSSVATVNCEMVATARWVNANLPAGALIAVHDIGAQGYFDTHPVLDLAGLVSPEVIPFIRDEKRLQLWMREKGASYAVFFPSWYPDLSRDSNFIPVHLEYCAATHAAGEVDLEVFRIRPGPSQ